MPSPSLAEEVMRGTSLAQEFLRRLVPADTEESKQAYMQLAVAIETMQRYAAKRMGYSDAERLRRVAAVQAVHLEHEIPAQRG